MRRSALQPVKIEHNGLLLRIYLSESRRHGRLPAHRAVVEALEAAGISGAIAFKGIEGFGRGHRTSSWSSPDAYVDLPILIEVVDEESKIRGFLPQLDRLVDDGLVTVERVQTVFYRYAAE